MNNPMIIAELSANHLGQKDRALDLVRAAAEAGADAVKIQCWDPTRMVIDWTTTVNGGPWDGRNLRELYLECWTPSGWIPVIAECAEKNNIQWFASVFDELALEILEENDCPIYKIASCEITDLPLIAAVARTGKPIVISTGMATRVEIANAVLAARTAHWNPEITVLKCTAAYPTPLDQANLSTIPDMAARLGCPVGLSDHSLGATAATAATALGATMIEKHLTLSRADGGPDAGFSSEPAEFAAMVKACRKTKQAMGTIHYGPTPQEMPTLALRRSLHFAQARRTGHTIEPGDILSCRPGGGLPPVELPRLTGRRLTRNVRAGEITQWEDFDAEANHP